jgi:hypothetical protein
MTEVLSGLAIERRSRAAFPPGHTWWAPLGLAYVPGFHDPALDKMLPAFLDHLRQTGHEVHARPGETTNLILTTARFGEPVPWRRALMLSHRRAFGLAHSPTVVTLVVIRPAELEAILSRLESSLAKDPPDPADFAFPGLTERAHRVLIEQGRRGGPMLSLVRLVQSQAICIRVILLVADDRPRAAYHMDLVGARSPSWRSWASSTWTWSAPIRGSPATKPKPSMRTSPGG